MSHPPTYHAYMLRVWRDDTSTIRPSERWRFSLEDPHTGERIGFASVQMLCAYLVARVQPPLSCDKPDDPSDSQI